MNTAPAAFRSLSVGRFRWRVRADVNTEPLLSILENPETFLADPAQHIKNSGVVTIASVPGGLILKRLNYGKFLHRLRDFFRRSRAQRALDGAALLETAGVNTPRALAACDVRTLRWPRAAYLITDEVPNAFTLAGLFHAEGTIRPELLRKLAALIARLHNHGLSHRDLKWTNILFDQTFEPWLIDLDGLKRFARLPDEEARANLCTLIGCFRQDQFSPGITQFLKTYCEKRTPSQEPTKWMEQTKRLLQARTQDAKFSRYD